MANIANGIGGGDVVVEELPIVLLVSGRVRW